MQVGEKSLSEEDEKELTEIMSEMGSIYGSTTVCFDGTEWSNIANKGNREKKQFDMEFQETFPTWDMTFSAVESPNIGDRKFLLKNLPVGGTSYSSDSSSLVKTYNSLLEKDKSKCLPLSPDLTEIMATSDDHKLRAFVWQVNSALKNLRQC